MMGNRSKVCVGKEVFIGIDVHKRTYALAVKTENGAVEKVSMPASPAGLVQFIKRRFPHQSVQTSYEAGFSGYSLHRRLEAEGIRNLVVNASSIPIASNDRVKTDKRDAKKLCDLMSTRMITGIQIPTESQESSRLLTRTREQLVKERSRIGIQMKSKLAYYGKMSGTDTRAMTLKLLREIEEKWDLHEDLKRIIGVLATVYRCIHKQVRELSKEIEKHFESQHTYRLYRSVPGIGPTSAAVLTAELGDMSQFRNERTVFSFTGLTPAEFSSGDHTRRGHISRQGSSRLRAILVEVAWRAIRKDKFLEEGYQRLKRTRGGKRAIVAIARRLIGRIRACITKNETYKTPQ
jgi:transposase